jgi:hypothetical protein
VICASTGNTAASAAAYAARAGMRAIVIIPEGKVAAGKLAGAVAYGAEVIQIDGSFDDALSLVVAISQQQPIALVNSLNPYRLEGQKTAAFEICEDLGARPTGCACRSATPATSPPTGWASASIEAAALHRPAAHFGRAGSRLRPAGAGPPGRPSRYGRDSHPHWAPGARRAGPGGG